jgi:hypothetical protein
VVPVVGGRLLSARPPERGVAGLSFAIAGLSFADRVDVCHQLVELALGLVRSGFHPGGRAWGESARIDDSRPGYPARVRLADLRPPTWWGAMLRSAVPADGALHPALEEPRALVATTLSVLEPYPPAAPSLLAGSVDGVRAALATQRDHSASLALMCERLAAVASAFAKKDVPVTWHTVVCLQEMLADALRCLGRFPVSVFGKVRAPSEEEIDDLCATVQRSRDLLAERRRFLLAMSAAQGAADVVHRKYTALFADCQRLTVLARERAGRIGVLETSADALQSDLVAERSAHAATISSRGSAMAAGLLAAGGMVLLWVFPATSAWFRVALLLVVAAMLLGDRTRPSSDGGRASRSRPPPEEPT